MYLRNASNSIGIPDKYNEISGPVAISGKTIETDGSYFYADLSSLDIDLEPGQVIGIEGAQIGYKIESNPLLVDRVASTAGGINGVHYIRFVAIKPEFLWFENTCILANKNITAKVTVRLCSNVKIAISFCNSYHSISLCIRMGL